MKGVGAMTEEEKPSVVGKWAAFWKGGKANKWIVGLGLAGMALILLSNFWPKEPKTTLAAKTTAEEFVTKTEQKLEALIGNIEGAGTCQVMVTLENGVEYVYASEQKTNTDRQEDTGENSNKGSQRDDTEQSIIVVDTEEGRQGLLVTEIQPTVRGVVVICPGGDHPEVKQRIVDAVTTALNLSSNRVCVTRSSGN